MKKEATRAVASFFIRIVATVLIRFLLNFCSLGKRCNTVDVLVQARSGSGNI